VNQKYHSLRKGITDDRKFCRVRLLDPANPKGTKKPFFSTNTLSFFDRHYAAK
jgi:hypothetical protein